MSANLAAKLTGALAVAAAATLAAPPPATAATAPDGLKGPTSIAIRHDTLYVPSAAYVLQKDPNLLVAHLR